MIFYLSCTGNTLWAAKQIAEATDDRLIDIAKAVSGPCNYELEKKERLGFCFPVHGWRPPQLFRQFIGKLTITNAAHHYCWALCTAGDDIGQSMELLTRDLASRKLKAESLFSLVMPESYVGLPFMDVDKPEKEREKKKTAQAKLNEIIPLIVKEERGIIDTYKGHWPRINSYILGTVFVRNLMTDGPFRVRKDKCIECGTCSKVCPVQNIDGGKEYAPVWLHTGSCLTCFACYHHCPTKAIEYGKRTANKGQYYFK